MCEAVSGLGDGLAVCVPSRPGGVALDPPGSAYGGQRGWGALRKRLTTKGPKGGAGDEQGAPLCRRVGLSASDSLKERCGAVRCKRRCVAP